ncbi:protein GID8 homolog [Malania oleifera]|uniref:protein GID8 homolog n=1 Tax=Malania oleifera TaxID=397392 RepID=UPI0025AE38C1|nr:protein GID8 homolog [Malania oleifera]
MMNSEKDVISREEWEKNLGDVRIRKKDMNELVMNFLVTKGFVLTAEIFHKESGTEPEIDLATMSTRAALIQAIYCGKLEKAVQILNSSYSEVVSAHPELLFSLQQQKLIELIRRGSIEEALQFCREYVAPLCLENPNLRERLERTISLLGYKDPSSCYLAELLDRSQVLKTANEVNQAILSSQGNEKDPKLSSLLKRLLSVQNELDKLFAYPYVDLSSGILKH